MPMTVTQIYDLVNTLANESLGRKDIAVVDATGLVSLGNEIVDSAKNREYFLNTLMQKFAKTIFSYRTYTSNLKGIEVDSMEFASIVQKIKVDMPVAVSEESYDLQDGESYDMYVVTKPSAKQKLFSGDKVYQYKVTISKVAMRTAFTSAEQMGAFFSTVMGEVQNAIELSLENLGRTTINTFIAASSPSQVVNLVSLYNEKSGKAIDTGQTSMFEPDFMRFAAGQINLYSNRMTNMSVLYNSEGEVRHTPKNMQRFTVLADFVTQLQTVVEYAAFNQQFVTLKNDITISYWQAEQSPFDIKIKIVDNGTPKDVELTNVVACLSDKDAFGIYRKLKDIETTPLNARALYYNTFWHMNDMYWADMSENGIIFTLN